MAAVKPIPPGEWEGDVVLVDKGTDRESLADYL
jgi:hypothetical protein